MKLIIAIINNDDSHTVLSELMNKGFYVTKLATKGGFLKAGNTTVLIGVEDEKKDQVLEIIGSHSKKRTAIIPAVQAFEDEIFVPHPVKITVGGATVFVIDVEQFQKM